MKLTNKKTTKCNCTTTTLNQTTVNETNNPFKILHIFSTHPKILNIRTTQLNRQEETQRLEIEAEIKRNQGRTYAGVLPPR
jgi:hypothetical protein